MNIPSLDQPCSCYEVGPHPVGATRVDLSLTQIQCLDIDSSQLMNTYLWLKAFQSCITRLSNYYPVSDDVLNC